MGLAISTERQAIIIVERRHATCPIPPSLVRLSASGRAGAFDPLLLAGVLLVKKGRGGGNMFWHVESVMRLSNCGTFTACMRRRHTKAPQKLQTRASSVQKEDAAKNLNKRDADLLTKKKGSACLIDTATTGRCAPIPKVKMTGWCLDTPHCFAASAWRALWP